jgi:serine/threonine-protein kinase
MPLADFEPYMREAEVGDRVDDFELTTLIARSPTTTIWKAIDRGSGATVVLKIPLPQYEGDLVLYERFRREQQIGERLQHPHLVRTLTSRDPSRAYVVLEHVEGRTLRARLNEKARLDEDEAMAIATQVCDVVAYLHEHGVVHRDLKPENMMLTPTGELKLLDLGIALDRSARRMTWGRLSNTIGTPDYMAPEQIARQRGDARTDVYAIGVLLFEMLTGQLPYSAEQPLLLMRMKTTDEPKAPSYFLPTIDPALQAIIVRAIRRVPRDRYGSIGELWADLKDPGRVRIDDETAAAVPAPQQRARLAVPFAIVVILVGLLSLMWLSR